MTRESEYICHCPYCDEPEEIPEPYQSCKEAPECSHDLLDCVHGIIEEKEE